MVWILPNGEKSITTIIKSEQSKEFKNYGKEGRIDGIIWFSKVWAIPSDVEKPADTWLKENKRKTNILSDTV